MTSTFEQLRRTSVRAIWLTALAVLLGSCETRPEPWNVLLVTFDTTRADRIGSYGNDRIRTPTLDGLADEGIRFANAVSVAPITAPSHSTILTGLYPTGHGVRDNGLFVLSEENRTLAEILKDRGYATAAAVGAFPVIARFGFDQGFDLFDDHLTGMYEDYLGDRAPKKELFFDERRAAQVNEAVIPWLEAREDEPFFLWLHYFDPHQPFEPPPPYDQLYADDLYDGEIAYADSRLGHILEQLNRLGKLDRTLIVMTADHGEGLGEHNEITHAVLAYDSTLHVPLIIRPPGLGTERARVIDARVGTVDIVPTILDLLGMEIPAEMHGQSLASLWSGTPEEWTDASAYTPQYYAENLSPRLTHGWGELRVLYEGGQKYIHGPRPELYDLETDPDELIDLAAQKPAEASRLREALSVFIREHASEQAATTQALEPELVSRLQSLGYLHGTGEGGEQIREELLDDGAAPQDRVTDLNRMSAAKHLLFKERPQEALNYTRKLVETDGNSPMYRELHASALAGAGLLDESWEIVRELQETGTVSAELVMILAAERFERGDHTAAIGILEDFASKTKSARALWLLSSFYQQTRNPERALDSLQRALDLNPEFAPARVDLAIHWARSGRADRADAEFRLALSHAPYYAKGNFNYGAFLFENGSLAQARGFFRRALDLAPRYLKAHLALVTVEHLDGNHEAARSAFRLLQVRAPDSVEAKIASDMLGDQ